MITKERKDKGYIGKIIYREGLMRPKRGRTSCVVSGHTQAENENGVNARYQSGLHLALYILAHLRHLGNSASCGG